MLWLSKGKNEKPKRKHHADGEVTFEVEYMQERKILKKVKQVKIN